MKTHELELIRVVDELNDRNKEIRARIASKPQMEGKLVTFSSVNWLGKSMIHHLL